MSYSTCAGMLQHMVSEPFLDHEKTFMISPLPMILFLVLVLVLEGNKVVLRVRNVLAPVL